jgi:hypothetical protein
MMRITFTCHRGWAHELQSRHNVESQWSGDREVEVGCVKMNTSALAVSIASIRQPWTTLPFFEI